VWLFLLAIVVLVIIFELTINQSFIGSDDAYIHLRYIQNLRDGHGFGFNPNKPSNGSTSPLWVVIAAIAARGNDLPQEVKYLSIFLFAASILVFYLLFLQLSSSTALSFMATCIYASDAWLLKWAGSAMESSLASLLILSVALVLIRSNQSQYLVMPPLVMGLATLARPEVFLLFLLFITFNLLGNKDQSIKFRQTIIAFALYSIVLFPWVVFTILTFGSPVPNTFLAKTVASGATVWHVGWYFVRVIGVSYWWAWIIALVGLVLFLKRGTDPDCIITRLRSKAIALLWVWCAIIPVYYSLSRIQTPSTRYLQITTPILIAVGFYGLASLIAMWSRHRTRYQRLALVGVAIGIVVYNIGLNVLVVVPSSNDFSEGILHTYRNVGEWIRVNTLENSRVAVAIDVGTIGYYSHREIIDLGGLNTPEVIPYLPDNLRYVFVSKPDYLVITGEESQYKLLDQTRFRGIAFPLISEPLQPGIRADIDRTTMGRQTSERYISVYRLSWE